MIALKVEAQSSQTSALEVPKFAAGLIVAGKNSAKTKNWWAWMLVSAHNIYCKLLMSLVPNESCISEYVICLRLMLMQVSWHY